MRDFFVVICLFWTIKRIANDEKPRHSSKVYWKSIPHFRILAHFNGRSLKQFPTRSLIQKTIDWILKWQGKRMQSPLVEKSWEGICQMSFWMRVKIPTHTNTDPQDCLWFRLEMPDFGRRSPWIMSMDELDKCRTSIGYNFKSSFRKHRYDSNDTVDMKHPGRAFRSSETVSVKARNG